MTTRLYRLSALLLLGAAAGVLSGQEDTASLWINVSDPSHALVPGAHLVLVETRTGNTRQADTNYSGAAGFDALRAGDYSLEVTKEGFEKLRIERVTVGIRDRLSLHPELKLLAAASEVTVTGSMQGIATDASHSTSVEHEFVENLPVNGRNPESLILMTPGITTAAGSRGGEGFNANGLRSNTNYYTLDGVSVNANVGGPMGGGVPMGGGPMGGAMMGGGPPMGGGGGAGSAITMDALAEMRVQTSSFAPEFGRSPGAQISMTSRGGTNSLHGSLFYYFRNDRLNANDWFANESGYPRSHMEQNRPGGTLGGPVIKDKTFFFVSYEALRLLIPSTVITDVPDMDARLSASAAMRPYLKAFALPNGAELGDGAAEFRAVVTNPSKSDSGSIRIDHSLDGKTSLFARYSLSLSNAGGRPTEMSSPNMLTSRVTRSQSFTLGGTRSTSATLLHDLRVSYSLSDSQGNSVMDSFGGAVPIADSQVFPSGITSENGTFSLSVLGAGGYSVGATPRNKQQQYNVVYSVTSSSPTHTLKAGVDFRRIMPTNYRIPYTAGVTFNGLSGDDGSLVSGIATNAQVSSNVAAVYPKYTNFSAYWQDTWRATERTTLTYGARWDVNPAPGVRAGDRPLALGGTDGVTQSASLYDTRWFDIAPRIGLAYQMDTTQGREMMFRMGFGLFNDTGYGSSVGAFGGAPYSAYRTVTLAVFPLADADRAAPVMPPAEPYGQVTAANRDLKSPIVFQWNATLERYFGFGQMFSIGYVGNAGRRLLRTESQPSFSDAYQILRLASNGATSDYHGLQVQFRRRLAKNIQTQLSYTYGHAIDSSSNDAGMGGGFASIIGSGQRGSSDYDVRHSLSWSGSFRLRAVRSGFLGHLLGDWYADWVGTARSGLPFDIQGVSSEAGTQSGGAVTRSLNQRGGLFAQVRPDYNGQPIWVSDPNVPGGRRVNIDAFTIPDGYAQGNLGRNALRGFGYAQVDLALRRQIAISESCRLNLTAQAYNALNHPNFANLSSLDATNLSSANFGVVTRMLNSGGFGGGAASLYQSGGPRSIELALRLLF